MTILSILGVDPILTLGNKKEIDIVIVTKNKTYTIDCIKRLISVFVSFSRLNAEAC